MWMVFDDNDALERNKCVCLQFVNSDYHIFNPGESAVRVDFMVGRIPDSTVRAGLFSDQTATGAYAAYTDRGSHLSKSSFLDYHYKSDGIVVAGCYNTRGDNSNSPSNRRRGMFVIDTGMSNSAKDGTGSHVSNS